LADRRSLLSPSAADVRRPAEPEKLSASCLAPLLVEREEIAAGYRSCEANAATGGGGGRGEVVVEEVEQEEDENEERYRRAGKAARRPEYNIGVSGTSRRLAL